MKKSIKDLGDIKGKRALVRVDINVPLDENKNVTDDTRIQAILPTLNFLKEKGAKIILMAHLGRPKGEKNPEFSLAPVAKYMSKLLGEDVMFIPDVDITSEISEKLMFPVIPYKYEIPRRNMAEELAPVIKYFNAASFDL